jgi:catechol 2,3-dioxygenase-like lactoylglutathione lyase family enzyme
MKRLHVHVAVEDLAASIRFYTHLFGAPPTVEKADYAKWRIEDPRVNFAVSRRGRGSGLDHLGIEVESAEELAELEGRLERAGASLARETASTCCYARSDKAWARDPQGIEWESFFTFGASDSYGAEAPLRAGAEPSGTACCVPSAEWEASGAACCVPPGEKEGARPAASSAKRGA